MTSRLDRALVERGLARSRQQAAEAIRAGNVLVDGTPAVRPAQGVEPAQRLEVTVVDAYVSRAAHKLANALEMVGHARAIPVRGGSGLDELPDSVDSSADEPA